MANSTAGVSTAVSIGTASQPLTLGTTTGEAIKTHTDFGHSGVFDFGLWQQELASQAEAGFDSGQGSRTGPVSIAITSTTTRFRTIVRIYLHRRLQSTSVTDIFQPISRA